MEKLLTVRANEVRTKIYDFEGRNIRTAKVDDIVYIIADDICNVLNFFDVGYVVEQLDVRDKTVVKSSTFINQYAVYQIIEMSASTDKAEYFRKWLDDEVYCNTALSLVVDNTNDEKEVEDEDKSEIESDNNFKLFEHEKLGRVRTVFDENNEPLFNLNDVAMILGYTRKNNQGKTYLRKDRIKTIVETLDITTSVHSGHEFIDESGLYDFIFESRATNAKEFRKWVTSEVLPTIRKTGGYVSNADMMVNTYFSALPTEQKTLVKGLFNNIEEQQKIIVEKDKKIKEQTPKVKVHDKFMNGRNYFDMKEVAKMIDWGRNKLFKQLRKDSILMTGNNHNEPYQSFVDRGYFKVIVKPVSNGRNTTVTLVTAKGADWLAKRYG